MAEDTLVDFAVVVFREDGQWQVGDAAAPRRRGPARPAARRAPAASEGPTLAVCSYGDDFFLALRPDGDDVRLMLSDATAAGDWPVARQALDLVDERGAETTTTRPCRRRATSTSSPTSA